MTKPASGMTAPEHMSYVAYCADCDGMVAAMVDAPDRRKGRDGTAAFVAQHIREGSRIERVTCQFVRDNLRGCTEACPCKWCVKNRAEKAKKDESQLSLAASGSEP